MGKNNKIPNWIRKLLDWIHVLDENEDFVVSVGSGKSLAKKGELFYIRHYHHIDRDRSNNEIWNLAPLGFHEHINVIDAKVSNETKVKNPEYREIAKEIYRRMLDKYFEFNEALNRTSVYQSLPSYEELEKHYREHLLIDEIEIFEAETIKKEAIEELPY